MRRLPVGVSSLTVHAMSWAVPPDQQTAEAGAETVILGRQFDRNVNGFGTGPAIRRFPVVSWPATVMLYHVHAAKGVAWVSVRIVFVGPFQLETNVTAGLGVAVTVAVSMGLLNVTTTFAVRETPVVPLTGLVIVICGLGHVVVKFHGFGTGPGPSGKLSSTSRAVTVILYVVHWTNGVACVSVTLICGASHACMNVMPPGGFRVGVNDVVSIASLKTMVTIAFRATLGSFAAGLVV